MIEVVDRHFACYPAMPFNSARNQTIIDIEYILSIYIIKSELIKTTRLKFDNTSKFLENYSASEYKIKNIGYLRKIKNLKLS